MIAEAIDAAFLVVRALAVWIVIGAFVGAVVVLGVAAGFTWAVKQARRALCGPSGASDGPEAAPDARDAPDASQGPSSDSSYEEAA